MTRNLVELIGRQEYLEDERAHVVDICSQHTNQHEPWFEYVGLLSKEEPIHMPINHLANRLATLVAVELANGNCTDGEEDVDKCGEENW